MLQGEKVGVRKPQKDEIKYIQKWRGDSTIMGRFLPIFLVNTERVSNLPQGINFYIIYLLDDSKTLVGEIDFCRKDSPQCMEIGLYILPEYRRRHYATEAIRIVCDFLFLSKDTVRIQAQTHKLQVISHELFEKIGFQKEGVLRKNLFIRGKWADTNMYSLLREEWKEPFYLKPK